MKAQRLHDDGRPLNAAVAAARAPVSRKKGACTRPCIRCREPFASEGLHNQLCHPCIISVRHYVDAGVFAEGVTTQWGQAKRRHGGT